jgi:hypothetical protein
METLIHDMPWSRVWQVDGCYRKWCGPSQRFEVALTVALASRWADRVTEVVDHGDDWLLLRDAGTPLRAFGDAEDAWLSALPLYAELQQREAAHVDAHLAAGVPDQRVETLLERFEEFPRFAHFRARFAELLEQLTLPPTVQHDDLHGGNVFARDGVIRVIDWGDTVIGHPFATLLVTLRVYDGDPQPLRDAYLEAWGREYADELDAAAQVAAFTRILSWRRIVAATDDPKTREGLAANIEWFLTNIASS